MASKLRILWMSDSPTLATGFGRVTREISSRLANHPALEMAHITWGANSPSAPIKDKMSRVYPSTFQACGQDLIESVVDDFKPDIVVTLGELRMIEWMAYHPVCQKFKWVAYVPLDGGPFYPPWEPVLAKMDEIIAMSEFGREILQSGCPTKRVRRIYHGVNIDCFRPLENRDEIKNHPRFKNRFVVGCVARNQPRKNLPALVAAFAQLSKRYEDLHLYLHSTPSDTGYDLIQLLKRFRLEGRADLASPALSPTSGLEDWQLNELYNLFDVMALPTCAEGFGLPILESMAAGVPVVATDFSACTELVRGRGELAKVGTTVITGRTLLEQAYVEVDDLAQCIERLYLSSSLRADYGRVGRTFAESLSWDSLMPQWLEVLGTRLGVSLQY